MTRDARKLLVIGWDAADWQVIDPLLTEGKMPNLAALINRGVRAPLRTLEPKLSPLLWTSIATGKTADKHGILNFVEPKPDGEGLRVVQSTTRRTKALWNIFNQSGLKCLVIGWYATHPAEPINGVVVSNLIHEQCPKSIGAPWPLLPGSVHPENLTDPIAENRQHHLSFDEQFRRSILARLPEIGASDERVETLMKLLAYAKSIEKSACMAMENTDWDAAFVFYDAIDTIGHHFMQYRKPRMAHVSDRDFRWFGDVMDKVYQWHDESLGRLLAKAGDDCTVLILSDHGFHSGSMRPVLEDLPPERRMEKESSWHRTYGVFIAGGPGVASGAAMAPATILDLAPTALALMGLPVGSDMDGRVLSELIASGIKPKYIPSWDLESGDSGQHPLEMREDPVETAAAIQQLIDLGYLAGIPENVQEQIALVRRESMFNLGVSLLSRNKFDTCIPIFYSLRDECPDTVRYAVCLAQALSGSGQINDAIRVLELVLESDSGNIECGLMLAQFLVQSGRLKDSIRISNELEKLSVKRPELAFNLAVVYLGQQRFQEALVLADKSCKLNPSDPMVHVLAGKVALQLGRFEDAAGKALDALDITQAFPEAHALLGIALSWYGDLDSAWQSLENAKAFHECPAEVFLYLAFLSTLKGRDQLASDYRFEYEMRFASGDSKGDSMTAPFSAVAFATKHGLKAG